MAEKLQKIHVETQVSDEELARTIQVLEWSKKDPENTPRMLEDIEKRIGHLVFEVWARQHRE